MIDFTNLKTAGLPAINIEKASILEARYNCFLALEDYNSRIFIGSTANLNIVRARLISWFLFHQAYLKRSFEKQEHITFYNQMLEDLMVKEELSYNKICYYIYFLNGICDQLRITRQDNFKEIDTTDIEAENEAEGV